MLCLFMNVSCVGICLCWVGALSNFWKVFGAMGEIGQDNVVGDAWRM